MTVNCCTTKVRAHKHTWKRHLPPFSMFLVLRSKITASIFFLACSQRLYAMTSLWIHTFLSSPCFHVYQIDKYSPTATGGFNYWFLISHAEPSLTILYMNIYQSLLITKLNYSLLSLAVVCDDCLA